MKLFNKAIVLQISTKRIWWTLSLIRR